MTTNNHLEYDKDKWAAIEYKWGFTEISEIMKYRDHMLRCGYKYHIQKRAFVCPIEGWKLPIKFIKEVQS